MKQTILLPRNIEIDINDVPDNLEEIVQKSFSEFTAETNPKYQYQDKLYYIDLLAEKLHGEDPYEKVKSLMLKTFESDLDNDRISEPEDFLSISFMHTCYETGIRDSRLYSQEYFPSRHDNEKVMQIICRVINAVMAYNGENDNG